MAFNYCRILPSLLKRVGYLVPFTLLGACMGFGQAALNPALDFEIRGPRWQRELDELDYTLGGCAIGIAIGVAADTFMGLSKERRQKILAAFHAGGLSTKYGAFAGMHYAATAIAFSFFIWTVGYWGVQTLDSLLFARTLTTLLSAFGFITGMCSMAMRPPRSESVWLAITTLVALGLCIFG